MDGGAIPPHEAANLHTRAPIEEIDRVSILYERLLRERDLRCQLEVKVAYADAERLAQARRSAPRVATHDRESWLRSLDVGLYCLASAVARTVEQLQGPLATEVVGAAEHVRDTIRGRVSSTDLYDTCGNIIARLILDQVPDELRKPTSAPTPDDEPTRGRSDTEHGAPPRTEDEATRARDGVDQDGTDIATRFEHLPYWSNAPFIIARDDEVAFEVPNTARRTSHERFAEAFDHCVELRRQIAALTARLEELDARHVDVACTVAERVARLEKRDQLGRDRFTNVVEPELADIRRMLPGRTRGVVMAREVLGALVTTGGRDDQQLIGAASELMDHLLGYHNRRLDQRAFRLIASAAPWLITCRERDRIEIRLDRLWQRGLKREANRFR